MITINTSKVTTEALTYLLGLSEVGDVKSVAMKASPGLSDEAFEEMWGKILQVKPIKGEGRGNQIEAIVADYLR